MSAYFNSIDNGLAYLSNALNVHRFESFGALAESVR